MPRYVSAKEAAVEIKVSTRTLQSLAARGLIDGAVRLGGGPRGPWMIPSPVVRVRADSGPKNRPGTPRHLLRER